MDLSPRPCSVCGDLRPVSRLSRPVVTCQPCRRGLPREKRIFAPGALTCADCGKPMWKSSTSLPQGRARCLPCRRAVAPPPRQRPVGDCHHCGSPVPLGTKRWKFCTDECLRKSRYARGSGSRPKTADRGYGKEHVTLRAKLLPLAYGTPCALCGAVMNEGDDLHLDHTEDRVSYRGMAHAACNVRDGASRGGQRARQARLERGWRPGQDPSLRRKARIGA